VTKVLYILHLVRCITCHNGMVPSEVRDWTNALPDMTEEQRKYCKCPW